MSIVYLIGAGPGDSGLMTVRGLQYLESADVVLYDHLVPARVAVPTYAGIPNTYPGGGDTLTFVRGHEDDGKARASIDWTSLARLDGTIVCYAGARQLTHMLSALVSHGRPADDNAAIIY